MATIILELNLDLLLALGILFLVGVFPTFILFLPALLELKKPKDGGPRCIMDRLPTGKTFLSCAILPLGIVDIDEEEESDFDFSLIGRVAVAIDGLPRFEA